MNQSTMKDKISACKQSLHTAGTAIGKISETEVGSLAQANAIQQGLLELRESLFWIVDALDKAEAALAFGPVQI